MLSRRSRFGMVHGKVPGLRQNSIHGVNRLQLQGELQSKDAAPRAYKGVFHGVSVILKNEGPRGLFRGIGAAVRNGPRVFSSCSWLTSSAVHIPNGPKWLPFGFLRTPAEGRRDRHLQGRKRPILGRQYLLGRCIWCSGCCRRIPFLSRKDTSPVILPFPPGRYATSVQKRRGWPATNSSQRRHQRYIPRCWCIHDQNWVR